MLYFDTPAHLDLPWEAVSGMIEGTSALEFEYMTVRSLEEAELFVFNYGYDTNSPEDVEELLDIKDEAIRFIERHFLCTSTDWEALGEDALPMRIPDWLYKENDIRKILVVANSAQGPDQKWSCALLKVMHIICHANNSILWQYFHQARQQIFSRYSQVLFFENTGETILGVPGGLRVSLANFEIKDEKSRDSLILKLLCKRELVAEELSDIIGVRIITYTPAEALMALEALRQNKVIIFPNLIPSRSRNSLIDLEAFMAQYQQVMANFHEGQYDVEETINLIRLISADTKGKPFNPMNPHSSETYRSIHLTQRQLIRFKSSGQEEETRFFFPYELQITDEINHMQSLSGSSAHFKYKQNQLVQARRRVLGPLLMEVKKQKKRDNKDLEPEPLS